MITAQDIREKTFEKSRMGGYDMASVDDFLEELADDVTATQKEIAVLKSKMKVLVDKIEEYRSNENTVSQKSSANEQQLMEQLKEYKAKEDAVNQSIISANKLAIQIENDARTRAAAIMEDAEAKAKARIGSIDDEVALEEKKLSAAKAECAKFFDTARKLCNLQLKNLDSIDNGTFFVQQAQSAAAGASIPSIEEKSARIQSDASAKYDFDAPKSKKPVDGTQPFTL